MQKLVLSFALIIFSLGIRAQTVTGSWFGTADVGIATNNNNYLTELHIRQKGNEVDGVFGYYFRDTYQSHYIRGTYNAKTRELIIKDIPVAYFKSTGSFNIDCPMNLVLTLMESKVTRKLKGYFFSVEEYKNTCGDLAVTFTIDPDDFTYNNTFNTDYAVQKIWKPSTEDFVINAAAPPPPPPSGGLGTLLINPSPAGRDSAQETQKDSVKIEVAETKADLLAEKFGKRKNIYGSDIYVHSDSIRISLYDNGDVDGDSISVFLNNVPIVTNQLLSARAITIYVKLDSSVDVNEISMFAENLGLYPPNTALMVVSDGVNQHEVFLSSSLDQNATIRIRRKKLPER